MQGAVGSRAAASLAHAVGPHARGIPRPYRLVVSDGLRARAGLMVLPVLLGSSTVEAQSHMTSHCHMSSSASPLAGMLATGVHTVGYLAVTGLVAWAFYCKLGLTLLRKTWFNFDLVWGTALVATGLFTLVT